MACREMRHAIFSVYFEGLVQMECGSLGKVSSVANYSLGKCN